MRFRLRPLIVLAFSIPTALMGVLAACGGGDTTTDAGNDATVDAPKDVTQDVKPDVGVDAGCDAPDLLSALPSPDASIDVDAGGFAIQACLGCLEDTSNSGCGSALNNCDKDCSCREGVIDAVTCTIQTQDLQGCFLTAIQSGDSNLITLVGCAQQKCLSKCLGGADGGKNDSGSSDAGDGGG